MLTETLRSGFALANRRPGLVLLDLVWKAIWLALTIIALLVLASWITSDLRSLEWDDTGVRGLNAVVAAAILREFWNANRGTFVFAVSCVVLLSASAWLILE